MEDLRVLEQQQRDSQSLLASIKLSKHHKLEQRSALESKLSELKYSNGESRAQLIHAREVLSKSTRELASTKLRSERSSSNLKKFDENLKKTLGIVRGLHVKRRKLDNALARLDNSYRDLEDREKQITHHAKKSQMELEDAKHRELLLVKSVQASKLKVQEFVEDTLRVRSELSSLEIELTNAQQLEASTRLRTESARSDIHAEKKRHEEFLTVHHRQMEDVDVKRVELESKIRDLTVEMEVKDRDLNVVWEECVVIQKEHGFEVSDSLETASLDMAVIRRNLDDIMATSLVKKKEEEAEVARAKEIAETLSSVQLQTEEIHSERQKLDAEIEEKQKSHEEGSSDRKALLSECNSERAKVDDLRKIVSSLQTKIESCQLEVEQEKEGLEGVLIAEKESLVEVTSGIDQLKKQFVQEKQEIDDENASNREKLVDAKKRADDAKVALEEVQKRGDELTKLSKTEDIEQVELEQKQEERLEGIRCNQMRMLKGESFKFSFVIMSRLSYIICITLSNFMMITRNRISMPRWFRPFI